MTYGLLLLNMYTHKNYNLLFKLNITDVLTKKQTKKNNTMPSFYQQVIVSFNKANGVNYEMFCNTIHDQTLWGNEFLKCNTCEGRNMTLMFKNGIASGVAKIGNLKFVNGMLDERFTYLTVEKKSNNISEMALS